MSGDAPNYLCGDLCGGGLRRCSPQRSGSVLEMARGDVAWSRLAYAARPVWCSCLFRAHAPVRWVSKQVPSTRAAMQARASGVRAFFMQVLSMQAAEAGSPLHLNSQEGHVGDSATATNLCKPAAR